jgi:hypothetical protein
MIKSLMFASQPTRASNRPRRLHPLASNNCHPACPERGRRERSEGSAFLPLVAHRRSPLTPAPVTHFAATVTAVSQLTEKPATLSPVLATLTRRVKPNPFVCHSYKKHPGVGVPHQFFPLSHSLIFSASSVRSVARACPDRVGALNTRSNRTTLPRFNQKPLPHALFSLFPLFSRKWQKLTPLFSHSSALLKKECFRNSFPINNFRTLSQNTRAVGPFLLTKRLTKGVCPESIATRVLSPSLRRYLVTSLLHLFSHPKESPSSIAPTTTRNH